jgi:aspartate carbamoyltransferase catalytic subunit
MERLPQRKQSNTGIFQTMEELVNESSAEFVAAALTSLNAGDGKQKRPQQTFTKYNPTSKEYFIGNS